MNIQKKIQEILDVLYSSAPKKLDIADISKKVDLTIREVKYLFRAFPKAFYYVRQEKVSENTFFFLDMDGFKESDNLIDIRMVSEI